MKIIAEIDYLILKNIPVYPEERSRGDIIRLIKKEHPVRYKNLGTTGMDAVLLKYTYMLPIAETKDVTDSLFFASAEKDADCLQCTLKELPLEWIKSHIGMVLGEDGEDEPEYFDLIDAVDKHGDNAYSDMICAKRVKHRRNGWYKKSSYRLRG